VGAYMTERLGWLKRTLVQIDKMVDRCIITMLVAMIFIVFLQVITRKIFSFVFFWSEEVTLLCLTWFSFMGIAIGFREKWHLAMDVLENVLPKAIIAILDRFIDFCIFLFGLYLVVYGWQFTSLMGESILPATQLPNSIQYIVMPITGVLTCVYSLLQLMGKDLRRYHYVEEEIKRDA
jgi:TRAP-type transport system small permease protein